MSHNPPPLPLSPPLACPVSQLGRQRRWHWRGWPIRYAFFSGAEAVNPPLLMLHGFGSNLNQWRDNLVPLAQQHPAYALDLLGFGSSAKAATLYGIDLWVDQAFAFWQSFIGRPCILVGHSLGALVALAAAVRHPAMASRLVMLTLPPARQELIAGWLDRASRRIETLAATPLLMRPLFYLVRRPGVLRSILQSIYARPQRVDRDLIDTFALPPQERGAARTLCYLVRSRTQANFSPSSQALIANLEIPSLLLWGDRDRVIPARLGSKYQELNSALTFKLVADGGHFCYDEFPERVNQIILDWLSVSNI